MVEMFTNPQEIQDVLQRQGAHLTRLLLADSGLLSFLEEHYRTGDLPNFEPIWRRYLESNSEVLFEDQLRIFKTRFTVLIFLREIMGEAVSNCASDYALLADFCISVALDFCAIEEDVAVIGLGKLGGIELNYGSDIDIMFVAKSAQSIQLKKVEHFVEVLDEVRSTGRLFRVDLRLRPEGSVGPLIQPLDVIVKYYLDWGREWERGMLLKARVVGGDHCLGNAFIEDVSPFVFRRSLDYRAIDALKKMKAAIESEAEFTQVYGQAEESETTTSALSLKLQRKLGRRQKKTVVKKVVQSPSFVLGWDIKIGRGGIREIEFFVQALQLVHGGRTPRVRTSGTLSALKRLFSVGLLSEKDSLILRDAYTFFRTLEHRVQMKDGEQTHRLPSSTLGFDQLADCLSMSPDDLRVAIIKKRKEVHTRFERLFSDSEKKPGSPTVYNDTRWSALLVVGIDRLSKGRAIEILQANGFKRPKDAASQIASIQTKRFGPFYEASNLASYCLSCCAESPDSDTALGNLVRFFQSVGDRPAFYEILKEHPHATRLLINMLGVSRTFSTQLIVDPNLFARFITAGTIAVVRSRADLQKDLENRLLGIEDVDHRFGIIRRFKQDDTLRVALHYIGGVSKESQTFSQLSDLADIVVGRVLAEVYETMRDGKREGLRLPELSELPFSIIALGKWGSKELSFSSDLDLMFIYEEERQYRLEHGFFTKLAARVMRQLSWQSALGRMYEVDARLRPSGSQGALVVSTQALMQYHETSELWERQALLRARSLESLLAEKFQGMRLNTVFKAERSDVDLGAHFVSMFTKIRDSNYVVGDRNPKFQPGGLVATEFGVQYLQFCLGIDGSTMEDIVGKIGALESDAEILGRLAASQLIQDYHYIRRVDAFLKISDEKISVIPNNDGLLTLSRRVGEVSVSEFLRAYDETIERLHRFWLDLFA